jgi:hypothetical protein
MSRYILHIWAWIFGMFYPIIFRAYDEVWYMHKVGFSWILLCD